MNKFPCTGCGSCCKRIDRLIDNINLFPKEQQELLHFPYKHEDGVCENLMEDNKCAIYENRPLICNIDKFIEVFELDKIQFYTDNINVCNKIMDEDGVSNELRIKFML